jgi:hypothetical protein
MLQSWPEVETMSNRTSSGAAPRTAAQYRAAIEEMLQEMERLNEQMRADQALIEQLRTDTAAIKTETRALLASMAAAA